MRYVYVLLNTLKPGKYVFDDLKFDYEPFYVGHGTGLRWKSHYWNNCESNKHKLNIVKSLKHAGHEPLCVFAKKNIDIKSALLLEIDVIRKIGRYPHGSLTNMSDGGEYYRGDNNIEIGQYKLIEDYKAKLIHVFNRRVDAELKYGNLAVCLDKDRIGYGFIWRRINNYTPDIISVNLTLEQYKNRINKSNNFKNTINNDSRVCKFDINGNFVDVFPNRSYLEKMGINCNYLNKQKLVLTNNEFFLIYAYKLKSININLFKQGFQYIDNEQTNNIKNRLRILKINLFDEQDTETYESIKHTDKERSLRRAIKNKGFLWINPYIWIKECDFAKLSKFRSMLLN